MKLYLIFGTMLFKDISIFSSGAEQKVLCSFGRRHYEDHFSEIILNLGQW